MRSIKKNGEKIFIKKIVKKIFHSIFELKIKKKIVKTKFVEKNFSAKD